MGQVQGLAVQEMRCESGLAEHRDAQDVARVERVGSCSAKSGGKVLALLDAGCMFVGEVQQRSAHAV